MRSLILSLIFSTSLLSCGATVQTPYPTTNPKEEVGSFDKVPTQQPNNFIEIIPPPEGTMLEVIPSTPSPQPMAGGALLAMSPTGKTNRFGNPIFKVEMIVNNKLVDTVYTVSGRAHTQNKNRNVSGTEAPLPNGRYRVARAPIAGSNKEVGKLFLPITPLFNTGRYALGFHVDPSFDKDPIEDGTEGCIGTTTVEERDRLFRFIQQYRPQYLEVLI